MAKNPQHTTQFAALVFEIGAGGVTTEAHLLPAGEFRAEDGRPYDADAWCLDGEIAAQVLARMQKRKNDTLIDYEHQSLRAEYNGQPVIAAGWFNTLDWRESGLWAIDIGWTDTAQQRIATREYRYISAVFSYLVGSGEVLEIISVALTNTPALDGLESLTALSKLYRHDPTGDDDMQPKGTPADQITALTTANLDLTANVASLTGENTKLTAQVAALTAERDKAQADLKAVQDKQAADAAAAETQQRDSLVTAALTDGRLAPAQKDWAGKQSLASLTEFLGAAAPIIGDQTQSSKVDLTKKQAALTKEEKDMCESLGVSEEDFIKARDQGK